MGWGKPTEGEGMSRWSLGPALRLGGKICSCFSQWAEGRKDGKVGEGQRLSLEETEGPEAERAKGQVGCGRKEGKAGRSKGERWKLREAKEQELRGEDRALKLGGSVHRPVSQGETAVERKRAWSGPPLSEGEA